MAITDEILHHTAELARLDLSVLGAAEVAQLRDDLTAILAHVAELDALDLEGVEPTTHAVPIRLSMRPDEAQPGPGREAILQNAPRTEDGYFVVPRVIAE